MLIVEPAIGSITISTVSSVMCIKEDEGERHDGECDCVQCELARVGLDE